MAAFARPDTKTARQSSAGSAARRASPAAVAGHEAPSPSPVQQLQDVLAAEFADVPERKWPPIVGAGFVLGASAAFWALAALIVSAL